MFSFLIDHVEIAQLKCNRETDESEVNLNEGKKKKKKKKKILKLLKSTSRR